MVSVGHLFFLSFRAAELDLWKAVALEEEGGRPTLIRFSGDSFFFVFFSRVAW